MRLLRGQTRLQLRRFKEAATDFARAVKLDPENIQTRYLCAISSAESEQWDTATEHLSEVVRKVGARVNPQLLYQLAQVSLAADRPETYRKACSMLVKLAKKTGDLDLANTAAWACTLGPNAVEDFDTIVALSSKAVAANPKSYPYLNTYAAILVRAGRHDDALKQLDTAIAAYGKGGTAID